MDLFRPAIDCHTHFHPPRLFRAIREWFARETNWRIEHPSDEAGYAGTLAAEGVVRHVVASYAHRPGMARELNDWLRAFADRHPGAVPLATVHPDDPDLVPEVRRALDELGMAGLKVHCEVQRTHPDDPRMRAAYDLVRERGRFVLMHAGTGPFGGNAFTSSAAGVERLLAGLPGLNVVVAHMGLYETAEFLPLLDRHPSLSLDTTMAFAADSPFGSRIDRSVVAAYADRILYGTDWPNIPYPYGEERDGLLALDLSDEAYRAIFHDNAARLLAAAGVA
ncbi:MAG TPA: amidohydrolase family protein [Thermodesulfobacteriota bacterium]